MQQVLVKTESKHPLSDGRPDACGSYVVQQDLLGVAIVRRVHREIGMPVAREIIRSEYTRNRGLVGNVWRAVVINHDFQYVGYKRLCRIAEIFDMDPAFEITRAYINPHAVFETCKRHRIVLSNTTKDALKRARERSSELELGSAA